MKYLNGSDIASYIKSRQANEISKLKQRNIIPKLGIVVTIDDPVIEVYLKLKGKYGRDIGAEVNVHRVKISDIEDTIESLNKDEGTHGIIVQLPIAEPDKTEQIVNLVSPQKDVDGLGDNSSFDPATPLAILWLLAGYNINLSGKNIVIVGKGRLVGAPLEKALLSSGITPTVINKSTKNIKELIADADVVITATGVPGLIKAEMLKDKAVVVDAGVASENGKTVGDLAADIYKKRSDLTITPPKGGVGPLTISALFENLIKASNLKLS